MHSLEQRFRDLAAQAAADFAAANDASRLETARARYFGRQGILPDLMKQLGSAPADQRGALGRLANEVKAAVAAALEKRHAEIDRKTTAAPADLDLTLPGRSHRPGRRHPLTQTLDRIVEVFRGLGFAVIEGPEIEDNWHCFDALNTPADHPARDLQDTLYLKDGRMLRTQTSTVQIRVMESHAPPIRIVAPGRVFRRDEVDATHSACFHQIEGLYVDEGVSVADLKGAVDHFLRALLGPRAKTRLRPHFFPYTEPSFEIDCAADALGIRGKEWLEIAGCGMVDPNVFKAVNYDPERWTGFAFGMGIERLAMILHGIDDIRLFYQNDLRFLRQF